MFGVGLSQNILDGYNFIANNYDAGECDGEPDDIFLLGFRPGGLHGTELGGHARRGRATQKPRYEPAAQEFDIYQTKPTDREQHPSYALVNETQKVTIKFIGVWDTVGGDVPVTWLKWLGRQAFNSVNVELGSNVRYAYHALAIDEHRKLFEATIWKKPSNHRSIHRW